MEDKTKKKDIKVRDLKPTKDAKGGFGHQATHQVTRNQTTSSTTSQK